MSAFPILGIGEVLWDLLPGGPRLGGAPCNFAFHCQQLGHGSRIISRVGCDDLGMRLRDELRALAPPLLELIQSDATHPTGTVRVEIDENRQPRYTITSDVAWDFVEFEKQHEDLARAPSAICFGSLAQRSPVSRATIRTMLDQSHESLSPPIRVFDINLRQQFYDREIIEESLKRSDWLKLNADELPVLANLFDLPRISPSKDLAAIRDRYGLALVCLTRGERGCLVQTAGEEIDLPGIPVEVADTIGAGDAFTAGLVCLTLEGRPLRDAAAFANRFAARVAGEVGATPRIDRREIES
ncbi:MAG: carbohydrate kinase family protein [Gemmataceae bacterium]